MRRHALVLALAVAPAAACGGGAAGPAVQPPTAPATNDPAFQVNGVAQWYVVETPISAGKDELAIEVVAPDDVETVDLWIAGAAGVRLDHTDGVFSGTFSVAELPVGIHDLLLAADGSDTAFALLPVRRTQPYFINVTTDWDFSDPSDYANDVQDMFHAEHPELVITHFAGPYTFTDPEVTPARRAELAAWLIMNRDTYGDEIGLHIHPYCHFVESALGPGTCITDQSTVYETDATGYTIKVAAYGEADFATLLEHADELFVAAGLGKPTTFRAGGWTASIETLRALEATGYVADTSALNWARLEEWEGIGTGELYRWNMEHWATIGDTSQPYYPNHDDILDDSEPRLTLLEVPDNGIMIDYVSIAEMEELFTANWDGATPLAQPVTLMMGYHPSEQFGIQEWGTVDLFLDHVDARLASTGDGPCIYVTLNQMPGAFPR